MNFNSAHSKNWLQRLAIVILIATVAGSYSERALAFDDSLQPFAVYINRTPIQPWPGYGIYLGNGLFITASHVAGRARETKPKIAIAGTEYAANLVKEGSYDGIDLTVLSVNLASLPDRLKLRRLPLCRMPPAPGEEILVVTPEGQVPSRIASPKILSPDLASRFSTIIADVARTGNSGSGVFDAKTRCLMGIMSRKIQMGTMTWEGGRHSKRMRDVAKYFVPASQILAFMSGRTN